jgi:hypothetical protein
MVSLQKKDVEVRAPRSKKRRTATRAAGVLRNTWNDSIVEGNLLD